MSEIPLISEHKKIVQNNVLCPKTSGFSWHPKIPAEFFGFVRTLSCTAGSKVVRFT